MVTDIKELVRLCEEELTNREYTFQRHRLISTAWDELIDWMFQKKHEKFDEGIGLQYCDEIFGTRQYTELQTKKDQVRMRAMRMLISYQQEGDFEFRIPSVMHTFRGKSGEYLEQYLTCLYGSVKLSERTLSNKRHYLYAFNDYLENSHIETNNISMDTIEKFYQSKNYSLALKHNCNSTLRLFLRYAYEQRITDHDYSIIILPDNYKKNCKLPTTYEESEIRNILAAVNRASAIGKRDYLILLLAAEYGWRSSDIINLKFNQIEWEKNTITFNQQKTDVPVVYPLLSSVGNAIIDYLRHGRPETDSAEIIVSAETAKKGQKLSAPTIHSIVTKYMRLANISNFRNKKHGAHSLRHSLATNMIKRNVSMPVISTVLGHQNTASTSIYLSIDTKRLKQCSLPIPELNTEFYVV